MQKIFEFILECITNMDSSNILELGQNFSENKLSTMKFVKNLTNWSKDVWIIPELNPTDPPQRNIIVSSKISAFKKSCCNTQLKANKSNQGFTQCN